MIIDSNDLNEARKIILKVRKENPFEEILVKAKDPEFNRKILEEKINVLLSPEIHNRKDKLKERDSGLNEVLLKIAQRNNIKIGIDIFEIQKLDKRQQAIVLSRIIQNISLCKKTKTRLEVFPKGKYKDHEIIALLTTLHASTEMA